MTVRNRNNGEVLQSRLTGGLPAGPAIAFFVRFSRFALGSGAFAEGDPLQRETVDPARAFLLGRRPGDYEQALAGLGRPGARQGPGELSGSGLARETRHGEQVLRSEYIDRGILRWAGGHGDLAAPVAVQIGQTAQGPAETVPGLSSGEGAEQLAPLSGVDVDPTATDPQAPLMIGRATRSSGIPSPSRSDVSIRLAPKSSFSFTAESTCTDRCASSSGRAPVRRGGPGRDRDRGGFGRGTREGRLHRGHPCPPRRNPTDLGACLR